MSQDSDSSNGRIAGNRDKFWLVRNYFGVWASKDPVAASEWAMQLPEKENINALHMATFVWAEKSSEEARKWIEQSSLSQEMKDKRLKIAERK